ncbi:hypothetical protein [uncultured Reyranella sp.]|uniref:hypothetical protein n=1 Tax=uncultured Reyranella sp. TaxID=735512 RepID=UPI0025EB8994|nr:hypothetical protein [uncultured Reyranella sp.]
MVQRSPNSHEIKTRAFPFVARLRREEPFRAADAAEWQGAADRIAGGPDRWYAHAGWKHDYGFKLIGFATQAQADEMLGVHSKTVRNYIVAGKLKLNGCGQIPIEAVDKIRSVA